MKILKVFNNNSVAAISDELGDIILTGSEQYRPQEILCSHKESGIYPAIRAAQQTAFPDVFSDRLTSWQRNCSENPTE